VKKLSKITPTKKWNRQGSEGPQIKVRQAFSQLQKARDAINKPKDTQNTSPSFKNFFERLEATWEVFVLHTRLFVTRGSTIRKLSTIIVRSVAFVLVFSLIYTIFIDTYFVIKQVNIRFDGRSYLEQKRLDTLVNTLQQKKVFGFVPLNSYWFVNSETLTDLGKSISPDIQKVTLASRKWPNTIDIEISTQPVAATLRYNNDYYLISRDGKLLGKDTVSQRTHVITMNSFSTPSDFLTTERLESRNNNLLQKIFFALFLENTLADLGYTPDITSISSDLPQDNDILITILNTTLLFELDSLSKPDLITRINNTLKSTNLSRQIASQEVVYIDMRFSKNIFVCYADSECNVRSAIQPL
jgi:hypothetical protein